MNRRAKRAALLVAFSVAAGVLSVDRTSYARFAFAKIAKRAAADGVFIRTTGETLRFVGLYAATAEVTWAGLPVPVTLSDVTIRPALPASFSLFPDVATTAAAYGGRLATTVSLAAPERPSAVTVEGLRPALHPLLRSIGFSGGVAHARWREGADARASFSLVIDGLEKPSETRLPPLASFLLGPASRYVGDTVGPLPRTDLSADGTRSAGRTDVTVGRLSVKGVVSARASVAITAAPDGPLVTGTVVFRATRPVWDRVSPFLPGARSVPSGAPVRLGIDVGAKRPFGPDSVKAGPCVGGGCDLPPVDP